MANQAPTKAGKGNGPDRKKLLAQRCAFMGVPVPPEDVCKLKAADVALAARQCG